MSSLDEVALALGISRQRAYQIEKVAMRNFRQAMLMRMRREGLELCDILAVVEKKSLAVGSMMAVIESLI